MTYLEEIVVRKKANRPPEAPNMDARLEDAPPPRDFVNTLGTYRTVVIAECKKASPSKGLLRADYDPVSLALTYQEAGANAISVLTDEAFFQGAIDDLIAVRNAVELPVLRKDFTLDSQDLSEARVAGADLILLIAKILTDDELCSLLQGTRGLGMEAIVEVHDELDVERALSAAASIIGINNRNLHTFETDLGVTDRLMKSIPQEIVVISESGISRPEHVHHLNEIGVRAALVGEALVRVEDPAELLGNMVKAGCPDCWPDLASEMEMATVSLGKGNE